MVRISIVFAPFVIIIIITKLHFIFLGKNISSQLLAILGTVESNHVFHILTYFATYNHTYIFPLGGFQTKANVVLSILWQCFIYVCNMYNILYTDYIVFNVL